MHISQDLVQSWLVCSVFGSTVAAVFFGFVWDASTVVAFFFFFWGGGGLVWVASTAKHRRERTGSIPVAHKNPNRKTEGVAKKLLKSYQYPVFRFG